MMVLGGSNDGGEEPRVKPNETSQSSVEMAELPLTMFPPQAETGVGVVLLLQQRGRRR